MGAVFVATDLTLHRRVAVKLLRPETGTDADTLSRFAAEARAVAMLGNPHIVPLFDFHGGETPFLVMELVEGESVRALLDRERTVPPERAAFIARQVLSALAAAHAMGTIHRDVKPSNMMLVRGAAVPDLTKLLDFGVAKMAEAVTRGHRTAEGMLLGTPQYMAPEQALGMPVDARSDVYAVGVSMFEMLAGYNPFANGDLGVMLNAVREVVPPSLDAVRPDVPADLARVVARALEKRPEMRFPTAAAMADALGSFARMSLPAPAPATLSAAGYAGGPPSFGGGPTLATAPPSFGGGPPLVAAPPSLAHSPVFVATAPLHRNNGVVLGVIIGVTGVLLLVGGAVAVVLVRQPSSVPGAGSEGPASAPGVIVVTGAPATTTTSAATAAGTSPHARGVVSAAPGVAAPLPQSWGPGLRKPGKCLCLPTGNAPTSEALCTAKSAVPRCKCERSDGVTVCPVRHDAAGECPAGSTHPVPGGATGGACGGFVGDSLKGKMLNTPGVGLYTCLLCGETQTFSGPTGSPCSGFNNHDGAHYTGIMDCTP